MINLIQIQRLVQLGQHRQLIERVLPTGRCRSRQAVAALCEREAVAVAALGLALLRACELSYMPAPLMRDLAGRLIATRRADRLFGDGPVGSIGASAAAIRGLIEWRDLCVAVGHDAGGCEEAIEESLKALAARQNRGGLLGSDAVGSAITLALLGDRPEFRAAIDLDLLKSAIDRSSAIALDLSRYAHAMAA